MLVYILFLFRGDADEALSLPKPLNEWRAQHLHRFVGRLQ